VDDFYTWLFENNHLEVLQKIDRRSGTDRRDKPRPGSGRRQEDKLKWERLGFLSDPDDLSQ
jgi:hypothetical protein